MSTLKLFFLFSILIFSSNCLEENAFIHFLKSFIQNHISNDVFVFATKIISKLNFHKFPDNFAKNQEAFKNHAITIKQNEGFIEDQHNYKDMSYGIKSLSENGCGLIATYNVLYHLTKKEDIDFPSIIKDLEDDGIILRGIFGTSMVAIEDYFKKNGFKTWSSTNKKDYDKIGDETDASILTVYNNVDDIFEGIHFMAITKEKGKYYVHNNGRNSSSIAYNSITDVLNRINRGKAKNIYLTGVYKK